jgi:hypothetical protein
MQGPNAWIARRTVFDDLKHTFGTRDLLTNPTPGQPAPPSLTIRAHPAPSRTRGALSDEPVPFSNLAPISVAMESFG